MSSKPREFISSPVWVVTKVLLIFFGGFYTILSTIQIGCGIILSMMAKKGNNVIFENIPTTYLWAALAGGILIMTLAVSYSKYKDVQKKKGEKLAFDPTYMVSAIAVMILSAVAGGMIVFEGLDYFFATPMESAPFACLVAFVIGAVCVWFIDIIVTDMFANGFAANKIIEAREATRKLMESEEVKKAFFQAVDELCAERGILDPQKIQLIKTTATSLDDPRLANLLAIFAPVPTAQAGPADAREQPTDGSA